MHSHLLSRLHLDLSVIESFTAVLHGLILAVPIISKIFCHQRHFGVPFFFTKFKFGRELCPDPTAGAYDAPPDPLVC